jgi:twitching motility protein PilT
MSIAYNEYVLQTCLSSGWISAEQDKECRTALRLAPEVFALDWLADRGYIAESYRQALEDAIAQASKDANVADGEAATEGAAAEPSTPLASSSARVDATTDEVANSIANEVGSGAVHVHPDGAFRHVNEYLSIGQKYNCSDIHIGVYAAPLMRRFGLLQPMWPDAPQLKPAQTERLLMGILDEEQKKRFQEIGHVDYAYEVEGLGRFRTVIVRQRRGIDGVFRVINTRVPNMAELGLDPHLKKLTEYHNGLVLITGTVGTGKSTTMAALVEEVNINRRDHIITLEDPIEYVFTAKGCQITQREVHSHTHSFANALRAALREDPDVIMVGEMRDLETISLAITASETGHLVFGTLHTSSAARTLDRMLDAFPYEQQAQIRTMVAGSLRGIISQQLVPRADGRGRVLATEVLINTPAAANLIREQKTYMLPSVLQTGKKLGMHTMDDYLLELVQQGAINASEAILRAENKVPFKQYIEDEE